MRADRGGLWAVAWRYRRPSERDQPSPHLASWDPDAAPRFGWPEDVARAYLEHQRDERLYARRESEERIPWLERIAADGSLQGRIELALALRRGNRIEQDLERSTQLLELAADTGDAVALDHLAQNLLKGLGTEPDPARAVALWRRAAEARWPNARYQLGRCLMDGVGVEEPAPVEGLMWLELAADVLHGGARGELAQRREALSSEQAAEARRRADGAR